MKRLKAVILPGIAVVTLVVLSLSGSTGASATSLPQHIHGPATCGVWSKVSSPNAGTSTNFLYGVAAISSTDVWAVGEYSNGNGGLTLVEHWNGAHWKVVASPNVNNSLSDSLSGVAAIAANNVWAVGSYYDASNTQQTLIEHWDGAKWSIVQSQGMGGLNGVAAIASNDVWAVGSISVNNIQYLTEHWNGSSWSVVSSSGPGLVINILNGIAAISANNVWAVGDDADSATPSAQYRPLIEHWNGSSWSVVTSPVKGTSDFLSGIAAVSASNVWAVGNDRTILDPYGPYFTFIEHWNGSAWRVIKSPSPGSENNDLAAAARVPATSRVWAVGFKQTNNIYQTLAEFYC